VVAGLVSLPPLFWASEWQTRSLQKIGELGGDVNGGIEGLIIARFPNADNATVKQLSSVRMDGLDLGGSRVTDAGLEYLKGQRGLGYLNLTGSKVTAKGVATLRRALPDCDIRWERQTPATGEDAPRGQSAADE
jgi:hypothetical protein